MPSVPTRPVVLRAGQGELLNAALRAGATLQDRETIPAIRLGAREWFFERFAEHLLRDHSFQGLNLVKSPHSITFATAFASGCEGL